MPHTHWSESLAHARGKKRASKYSNFQNINPVWRKHTINSTHLQRRHLYTESRKMQPTQISIFHGHLAPVQHRRVGLSEKCAIALTCKWGSVTKLKLPDPLTPPSLKLDRFLPSVTNGWMNSCLYIFVCIFAVGGLFCLQPRQCSWAEYWAEYCAIMHQKANRI